MLLLHLPVGVGDRKAGDSCLGSGIWRVGCHPVPRVADLGAQVVAVAAPVGEEDDPLDGDSIDDLPQFVADPLVAWHKPGQVKHDKISLIEQHVHGGFPDIAVAEKRPWRIAAMPVTSPDCLRADVLEHVPARPAGPGGWAVEFGGKLLLRLDKQPVKAP